MYTLQNIAANDLLKLTKEEIIKIDVRREQEWIQTGIIENSHLLTFFDAYGNYDFENWLKKFEKIVPTKNTKFILICAHAHRTQNIGDYLAQKLEYSQATHLEGGIARWQQLELKTLRF